MPSHVLCITLVFGSILVVDLRLLGLLDRSRPVTRVSDEMLRLTWIAFAGAVVTGVLYFIGQRRHLLVQHRVPLQAADHPAGGHQHGWCSSS